MQNIYYSDRNFTSKQASDYILSIRFATDGLSFCVYDTQGMLMLFEHHPLILLGSQEALESKVRQLIADHELLNLAYGKVYILFCKKEKLLIPAEVFNTETLPELYKTTLPTNKDDLLLFRKIEQMDSFLTEAVSRDFVHFLTHRFPDARLTDSSYPFIIHSLTHSDQTKDNLFMDIHETYFDLLLTKKDKVVLFNSFSYHTIADLLYYSSLCLKACDIEASDANARISGNWVNDPKLYELLRQYIPQTSVLKADTLERIVKDSDFNSSPFVYLLSIHTCES